MKAVIFDYKGVLENDLKLNEDAYIELGKRHDFIFSRADLNPLMHKPAREKIEILFKTDDKKEVDALLKEKETIYVELAKQGNLFPAALRVVEKLSRKYSLAVITNSTRKQLFDTLPEEFLRTFKVILTSEDIDRPKPAPNGLVQALKELRVQKNDACYVGDSLTDMGIARHVGILGIGITTGHYTRKQLEKAGADMVVESLEDLEETLK